MRIRSRPFKNSSLFRRPPNAPTWLLAVGDGAGGSLSSAWTWPTAPTAAATWVDVDITARSLAGLSDETIDTLGMGRNARSLGNAIPII